MPVLVGQSLGGLHAMTYATHAADRLAGIALIDVGPGIKAAGRAITCPVLVVRGAESDVYSDTQAASFAASLPDGRWAKVAAAGHNVQGDNPRGLVEVLTAFLTDIGR